MLLCSIKGTIKWPVHTGPKSNAFVYVSVHYELDFDPSTHAYFLHSDGWYLAPGKCYKAVLQVYNYTAVGRH